MTIYAGMNLFRVFNSVDESLVSDWKKSYLWICHGQAFQVNKPICEGNTGIRYMCTQNVIKQDNWHKLDARLLTVQSSILKTMLCTIFSVGFQP